MQLVSAKYIDQI